MYVWCRGIVPHAIKLVRRKSYIVSRNLYFLWKMLFLAQQSKLPFFDKKCVCLVSRNRSACNKVGFEEIGHCFAKPEFFEKNALFGSVEQITIFRQKMCMSDVEESFRMQWSGFRQNRTSFHETCIFCEKCSFWLRRANYHFSTNKVYAWCRGTIPHPIKLVPRKSDIVSRNLNFLWKMLFLARGSKLPFFDKQGVCLMSRNFSACNKVGSEEIGHCFAKPVFFVKNALFGSREQITIFRQTMCMSDRKSDFFSRNLYFLWKMRGGGNKSIENTKWYFLGSVCREVGQRIHRKYGKGISYDPSAVRWATNP